VFARFTNQNCVLSKTLHDRTALPNALSGFHKDPFSVSGIDVLSPPCSDLLPASSSLTVVSFQKSRYRRYSLFLYILHLLRTSILFFVRLFLHLFHGAGIMIPNNVLHILSFVALLAPVSGTTSRAKPVVMPFSHQYVQFPCPSQPWHRILY
jgi:hypothetical protein